jgi:hypothetical protein
LAGTPEALAELNRLLGQGHLSDYATNQEFSRRTRNSSLSLQLNPPSSKNLLAHELPQTHQGFNHRDANRRHSCHSVCRLSLHGSEGKQAKLGLGGSRRQYNHCFRILDFFVQTCVDDRTVLGRAWDAASLPLGSLYLCSPSSRASPLDILCVDELSGAGALLADSLEILGRPGNVGTNRQILVGVEWGRFLKSFVGLSLAFLRCS